MRTTEELMADQERYSQKLAYLVSLLEKLTGRHVLAMATILDILGNRSLSHSEIDLDRAKELAIWIVEGDQRVATRSITT